MARSPGRPRVARSFSLISKAEPKCVDSTHRSDKWRSLSVFVSGFPHFIGLGTPVHPVKSPLGRLALRFVSSTSSRMTILQTWKRTPVTLWNLPQIRVGLDSGRDGGLWAGTVVERQEDQVSTQGGVRGWEPPAQVSLRRIVGEDEWVHVLREPPPVERAREKAAFGRELGRRRGDRAGRGLRIENLGRVGAQPGWP